MSFKNIDEKKASKVFTVDDEIRIVLIGKTGVGKSETGNSIIGKDVFKSGGFGDSVTQKCEMAEAIRGDKKIVVVDTPGLFDYRQNIEKTKVEVAKCFGISAPGVHCFLVTVQADRFSEEDKQTLEQILQMFGENVHRYAIVLLTKVDHVGGKESDEKKFQQYIHVDNIPAKLQEFLQKVDQRCTWINNREDEEKKEVQVSELFKMIQETVKINGGKCYTNEMYKKLDQKIREEMDRNQAEKEKQEKEKREKARQKIEELREQHTKEVDKIRRKIKELLMEKKRQEEENKRHEEEKKKQDSEKRERARQKIEEELRAQHKKEMDDLKRKMEEELEKEKKRQEEENKRHEEEKKRQEEENRRKARTDFQKGDKSFLDKFQDVFQGLYRRFVSLFK